MRFGLEAGAEASSVTLNQYVAKLAKEGLRGKAEEAERMANLSLRVERLEQRLDAQSANITDTLDKVVKAVSALGDRFADLAEGVETLAERVIALKQGVTGGAVQVIDTPASANGGVGAPVG